MGFIKRIAICMKKNEGSKTTILSRVARLVFISALVIAVAMLVMFNLGMKKVLKENYEDQVCHNSQMYASTISQWVDLIKQQLEYQATNVELVDKKLSLEERTALLQEAADLTEFDDFCIAESDGKAYNGSDISKRNYFINAMAGTTYVSHPIIRQSNNSISIMVGTKMKTPGFDGVVYGGIKIDFFSNLLADIKLGKTAQGFIVDKEGHLIAASDVSLVEKLAAVEATIYQRAEGDKSFDDLTKVVDVMKAGQKGSKTIKYIDGKEYLVGYYPIGNDEGWSVAVMVRTSETTEGMKGVTKICIIVAVAILLISFLFNLIIAAGIAFPVHQANEELKKIAEGELSGESEEYKLRKDETGELLKNVAVTKDQLNTYIGEIGDVVEKIAKGDLDQAISRDYTGDFVKIKNSLNMIIDSFNNTFMNAGNASMNLLEGSRQVEMASQALASASTEQASAVVEITSSIEGITKSVSDNTENVIKVNGLTRNVKNEADLGNEEMHRMIEAMDDISNSSQSIAKIMKVIDDIAFQTNILALNASVEAARAGVHGKGFAVVAEEVRALAGKSAEAANEIDEMIADTIKKIEAGSDIASKTAAGLEKVVTDIDEIAKTMEQIAEMSKEQAVAIEQVNTGIEQISSAVQNNSATSEECAASSVELANQAESMMKQIKYYNLRK